MFRYTYQAQVRALQFREFFESYEKFEAKSREKGYTPSQLLSPVVGTANMVMIVADYESLDQFQKEGDRFNADGELMGLYREMYAHLDGYAHDEIWYTASQIA